MTYRSIRGLQLATICLNGSLEHDEAHLWLSQDPTVIVSLTGGLENSVVLGKLGLHGLVTASAVHSSSAKIHQPKGQIVKITNCVGTLAAQFGPQFRTQSSILPVPN